MKYRLKILQETSDVEVLEREPGKALPVQIDDRPYQVLYRAVSGRHLHLSVGGRWVEAFVAPAGRGKHIFIQGRTFLVEDADRLPSRPKRRTGPTEAPGDVTPPMPAVVVRILFKEGDRVKKGEGLLVVTAMKMETTLKAPKDGRIKKINTSVDAKVTPGDILVEIEEEVNEHE
jgi:3-methylcrotonyl-CoA carboxylase alpha subunit